MEVTHACKILVVYPGLGHLPSLRRERVSPQREDARSSFRRRPLAPRPSPALPGLIRIITETSQDPPITPPGPSLTRGLKVLRTTRRTTPHFSSTVLHGSEDGERAQILRSLIPAIALGSKILIDEMVLPNTGVHWWSASMDLHMYTMLGSMEQNED